MEFRVELAAAGHDRGEKIRHAPVLVDAEPKGGRGVGEGLPGAVQLQIGALEEVVVGLARLGQNDLAAVLPQKELDAQLILQRGDVAADRRLRQQQVFGGTGEV